MSNEVTTKKAPYKVPECDYPNRIPAINEVTGARLTTGVPSQSYLDNYDLIFGKKDKNKEEDVDEQPRGEDK